MSTYQDIRGALQIRAITASVFPTSDQIAYEGRAFEMTVGVPWARMALIPSNDGPFSVDANTRYVRGLFQVDLNYPGRSSPGTATVEQAADAVIAKFKSGTRLVQGSLTVTIDSAQRGPVMTTEDWQTIPVTVAWRAYPAA